MESTRLSQWLTFGANIAVLGGIVLILIELNQNSNLMRAQIAQIRADNQIESMESRMHSDYWPAISAKLRTAGADGRSIRGDVLYTPEMLSVLNAEERERVFYFYLREINDLRNQFFQLQQGYFPEVVWNTSSRSQVVRTTAMAAALGRPCNRDKEFQAELNRIAGEEGGLQCTGVGDWKRN
jgi:hypothetical protein